MNQIAENGQNSRKKTQDFVFYLYREMRHNCFEK